jgi:outer membrane lipoprotein-sorting protein
MKKKGIFYIISAAILILSGFVTIAWADSMEQLRKEAEGITSVRAEFTQEKHMKILIKPILSKGVLLFKNPKSIRWEYFSPVKSILLMDNGKVKRFIEGENGLVEDKGASVQIMQFVLQEITYWLNGKFDNSPNFTMTLQTGRTITLTPREESFSKMIERIELKLSDVPGVMDRVKIIENKDTYTEYKFNNTQVNIPIDDSVFRKI